MKLRVSMRGVTLYLNIDCVVIGGACLIKNGIAGKLKPVWLLWLEFP